LLTLEGLSHTGDVDDWLDAGHTASELRALIDAAPDLDAVAREKRERKRRLARERQRRHRARHRAAEGSLHIEQPGNDSDVLSRGEGIKRSVRTNTRVLTPCNVRTFPSVTRDTARLNSASDEVLRQSSRGTS
jgi:hypothetical protein